MEGINSSILPCFHPSNPILPFFRASILPSLFLQPSIFRVAQKSSFLRRVLRRVRRATHRGRATRRVSKTRFLTLWGKRTSVVGWVERLKAKGYQYPYRFCFATTPILSTLSKYTLAITTRELIVLYNTEIE